jgi:lipid II:glycine glycyltransferase (peptidoglycan interpeptide bridge formation enzyme)
MGSTVFHAEGDGWMWLGLLRRVGPFRRLYLPYGPQVRDDTALREAVAVACACARAERYAFVEFEPLSVATLDPAVCGARRVRSRQAEYTRIVRLDVDETALRAGLTKGHRSAIHAAERRGVVIECAASSDHVNEFLALLHETYDRAHMPIHGDAYYRAIVTELAPTGEACLYLGRHEGRALAAAIVLDLGRTRYYAYAGSSSDPEARRLGPSTPLVWRTMLDARADGKVWFDFWGIAPPDEPGHAWSGFSAFKRSFGGEVLRRNGTWDLPIRPLAYRAWALLKAVRR